MLAIVAIYVSLSFDMNFYTKTAGIGMQLSRIGEQLPCTRELGIARIPSLWQW